MDRKELTEQYKNREQTGGVYAIKNLPLDKWLVDCAPDIKSAENRFSFFGGVNMKLKRDFETQKGVGFEFCVLETLKKIDTQTDRQFRADLEVLKAIWLEKLAGKNLY
jgi:hypothetical protein